MPRVRNKNEVDVVSTTCVALPFRTLHCQNGALCAFTNECAPRHHHAGGTTSLHHHSFDHILRCTGPIFSKLKPLEQTWDTSYAAKSKIHKMSFHSQKSMPCVCTKNEVDVVSTTCGALPFRTLHCQNGALRIFTNECAPRHHHDGGTTTLHCHSFDCTGPILSKFKPLERTWDTSYAA